MASKKAVRPSSKGKAVEGDSLVGKEVRAGEKSQEEKPQENSLPSGMQEKIRGLAKKFGGGESKEEMLSAAQQALVAPVWKKGIERKSIETDYDRVLDAVKGLKQAGIKQLSKQLNLPPARIEEELKTLEENGLVEVRYPPIGGAVVRYKEKKEA